MAGLDARDSLERFIRWVMRDTTYDRLYEATVQRQHDDGTLDLLADDHKVRGVGHSRVPIRHGLPAVEVRVHVGSRVLLGFAKGAGRVRFPYAACWDASSIESISFNGGEAPVARQGDAVAVYWPTVNITGAIVAPPATFTGVIAIATQSPGLIQTGAARVKA